jgi:hypothetical protein
MRQTRDAESWVVYERTVKGKPSGVNVVCEQSEWDALQTADPGAHTLIRAGIANEGEAERCARDGTPSLHTPASRRNR